MVCDVIDLLPYLSRRFMTAFKNSQSKTAIFFNETIVWDKLRE